ncbi:hypothetical protein COE25_29930 [Bacillus sp. AFS031507]|nr:hypothetical protein COE25_29930 [Bacillus sp. AFS031507]
MPIRFGQVHLKKSNGTMPPHINYTLKRFNRSSSYMKKPAKEQGSYGQKVRNSGVILGNTKSSFPSNIKKQRLN